MSTELQQKRQVLAFCPSMNNRQVQFETFATNYGELKRDLINAGITNLDKMKVIEGRTQLEFVTENSVLPSNIRRKNGTTTNDLVLVLTPAKINNGADLSRQEIFAELKSYRSISKDHDREIKTFFSNYTRTPNDELVKQFNMFMAGKKNSQPAPEQTVKETSVQPEQQNNQEIKQYKKELREKVLNYLENMISMFNDAEEFFTEWFSKMNASCTKLTKDLEEVGLMEAVKESNIAGFDDFTMEDAEKIAYSTHHRY